MPDDPVIVDPAKAIDCRSISHLSSGESCHSARKHFYGQHDKNPDAHTTDLLSISLIIDF